MKVAFWAFSPSKVGNVSAVHSIAGQSVEQPFGLRSSTMGRLFEAVTGPFDVLFFNGEVFVEKDQQETTVMMKSKMVCFEESNCDSLIGHVDSHLVFSYQKLRIY